MRIFSLRQNGKREIPYRDVWDFQKSLVEKRAKDEIEDTLLFVEHTPVITRGRGLQWTGAPREPMPLMQVPPNTDYFEIERGGDLTWHGPGQLVLYPIVKLKERDVGGFLRKLEKTLIEWCALHGLSAEMRENATGVWLKSDSGKEQKIASIGIAIRRWVTYHGVAINLTNDLSAFRAFSPCGFDPEVMSQLWSEPKFRASFDGNEKQIREKAEREIASLFISHFASVGMNSGMDIPNTQVRVFDLSSDSIHP